MTDYHYADFLSALTKLRKVTISFVMSVRLSVRMKQLGSHQMDFHEILYLSIFRKYIEKIEVSLKYDKNNGHFASRTMYIFHQISLSSWNDKYFREMLWTK